MAKRTRRTIKMGEQFGKWKVIKPSKKTHCVICRCYCGKLGDVYKYNLLNGKTTGCQDCADVRKPSIDHTGKRCGHWTVLKYVASGKWKIQCDCGITRTVKNCRLNQIILAGIDCSCIECNKIRQINEDRMTMIKLGSDAGMTTGSIASLLGMSWERVRQIIRS